MKHNVYVWRALAVACADAALVEEKVVHVRKSDHTIITGVVVRCSGCGRYVNSGHPDIPVKSHSRYCVVGRIERLSKTGNKTSAT